MLPDDRQLAYVYSSGMTQVDLDSESVLAGSIWPYCHEALVAKTLDLYSLLSQFEAIWCSSSVTHSNVWSHRVVSILTRCSGGI